MDILIVPGGIGYAVSNVELWNSLEEAEAAHEGATCLDASLYPGVGIGFIWGGSSFTPPPAPPALPWPVRKLTIRRRLREANLEAAFNAAFATLSQADQDDYRDCVQVSSGEPKAIAILQAIGADPVVILAVDSGA